MVAVVVARQVLPVAAVPTRGMMREVPPKELAMSVAALMHPLEKAKE
jgi:hypothetical protein